MQHDTEDNGGPSTEEVEAAARYNALEIATRHGDEPYQNTIDRAQAYYEFLRGNQPRGS